MRTQANFTRPVHAIATGPAAMLRAFTLACLALPLAGCGDWTLANLEAGLLTDKEQGKVVVADESTETQSRRGRLGSAAQYVLFDLGASTAGDEWRLSVQVPWGAETGFVLAMFDGDSNLLWRDRLTSSGTVTHVLRTDTDHVYAAVMSTVSQAVDFELSAARISGGVAPAPQAQVVWLNFAGARDVRINGRTAETFGAFNAADLGPAYQNDTAQIKAEITRTIRNQYAGFNVIILSSDEEPEPAGPHSTVHFGGDDDRYLGLGAGVDRYNENPNDQAIVYTRAFGAYRTMRLTLEEVAQMVGNAASHELGHLLGLFHTRGADQLMDDTRSAWALVGDSYLERAVLADSVFPMGMEDSAAVLAATVGLRDQATE